MLLESELWSLKGFQHSSSEVLLPTDYSSSLSGHLLSKILPMKANSAYSKAAHSMDKWFLPSGFSSQCEFNSFSYALNRYAQILPSGASCVWQPFRYLIISMTFLIKDKHLNSLSPSTVLLRAWFIYSNGNHHIGYHIGYLPLPGSFFQATPSLSQWLPTLSPRKSGC